MGKLRQTALILGEGPTEFFYFKSLCDVEFFETHRCTELFFLYYFRYTSRSYNDQEPLLKDLNQCVEYRKAIDFFIKTKGLHGYFERNGGSLEKAVGNASRSMDEKLKAGRDYTYSELGRLVSRLEELQRCNFSITR